MFAINFRFLICLFAILQPSYEKRRKKEAAEREQMKKLIIDTHNDLRRSVAPEASDMLKMFWNEEAAKNAQDLANQCIDKHSELRSRKIGDSIPCGENIYMSSHNDSWDKAIKDWYSENKNFIYGKGAKAFGDVIGHYTQLVWSDTDQVGCGMGSCSGPYTYIFICHYCPMGNDLKTMNTPYAQGTPCSACKETCDNKLCVP